MDKDKMRRLSQELRKNATKEENKLWYEFLRTHPRQFNRQRPIGPYIVDFYCYEATWLSSWMDPSTMKKKELNMM